MFFRRKTQRFIKKKGITVIHGVHPGAGLRYLSIAMGVYLSRIRRKKTMFLEIAECSRLRPLLGKEEVARGGEIGFLAFGCLVFPELKPMSAFRLMKDEFDEVIVTVTDPQTELPLPGDAVIYMTGSLKPWHFNEYLSYFSTLSKNEYYPGCCLSYGLTDAEKMKFTRETGTDVMPVPFIGDPLALNHEEESYFKNLLGG